MNDAERDAWLREALRHAPDANAAPPSGVSEAILLKARAAARTAAPAARRGSGGAQANPLLAIWDWLARPPVAAGFASVMAATLVGLMWWDRPMDEGMPRPPAVTSDRSEAAPPLASTAPAPRPASSATPPVVAAPPTPQRETAKSTTSSTANDTKAARDDGAAGRRQRSEPKQSPSFDAQVGEGGAMADKRKVEPLAKERAPDAEAKNEAAAFPATPAERETQAARKSIDAPATASAKKGDEARRSGAADAIDRAAAPPAAQSMAPAPAPGLAARPAAPNVATAPAATQAVPAATTPPPREAGPAPFNETPQRQRALGELRAKDDAGVASAAPAQAAAPSTAPLQREAERGRLDRAQQPDATPPAGAATNADAAGRAPAAPRSNAPPAGTPAAAAPLTRVLAAIAADPEHWSRRTASGAIVALDPSWRTWLAELDAATGGRWHPIDGAPASDVTLNGARDGAATGAGTTTLRLLSDGRVAAVVRVDGSTVQLDAAPATGSERWQAALSPAAAERLRTTSRRLAP